jgi:hypothetical protein
MQIMTMFTGNRVENVSVKFSDREKLELEKIANLHDRGIGYIVRELAFRGLALYKQDGNLKLTKDEEKAFDAREKTPIKNPSDAKVKMLKPKPKSKKENAA